MSVGVKDICCYFWSAMMDLYHVEPGRVPEQNPSENLLERIEIMTLHILKYFLKIHYLYIH